MEKAYDLKDLGSRLKKFGLNEAEDDSSKVYTEVMDWVVESAALSTNQIDDLVIGFRAALDKVVLSAIDKIDGEEG